MDSESGAALPKVSPFASIGSCLALSVIYVSSLYVWSSEHNRDHPSVVKRRFFSVFIVMLISPVFVNTFSADDLFRITTIWEAMGLRLNGLLPGIVIPLFLTALLFLGPISVHAVNGVWKFYLEPVYWTNNFRNVLWLRNHIVAPLSEEFTFRACMMPLLLQSFAPLTAVCITPLFFGVAHFHHMVERLRTGMALKTAVTVSCFQFTYTSIFGIYSAYLFAKTGHFAAPLVAHMFCNHMGFPDFVEPFKETEPNRKIFGILYIIGLIGWLVLIPVVTDPNWFQNTLYYKS